MFVEPVKDYAREEIAAVEATSLAPLNRVVDAARPESETARHFSELVNAPIAGQADANAKQEIAMWLSRWRDNQANLHSLESQSFYWEDRSPGARPFGSRSNGTASIDYVNRGERAPD